MRGKEDRRTSASYAGRATFEEAQEIADKGYTANKHDIARLLGVHPEHVLRMARDGEIPGHKFGKAWRFPAHLILKMVEGEID